MPKFSIIVPAYNMENYIEKCLDSIMKQSFTDYEVIVVNDGSQDNTKDLIKKYPVKIINQKNEGLSAARNNGVKKAKGEYLLFIDSDDWIEKDLLKRINKSTKNNPDLIRFQIREVYSDRIKKTYNEEEFIAYNGVEAFNIISKYHFVENAWCYAIKRDYYLSEKFEFKVGTVHEDFGLIPLVIIKSKIVNSINYIGYNYLQREGSIMSSKNYEKTKKKVSDMFGHYKYLIKEINKTRLDSKVFKSFVSNSMILKICELEKKDYIQYKNKLKEEKVYENILTNSLSRKVKKVLVKLSPKFYYKIMK